MRNPIESTIADQGGKATTQGPAEIPPTSRGVRRLARTGRADVTQGIGPIELALISNRMDGIIRTMVTSVMKSARSGVINVAKDFSCVIVTADDEILTAADSLPIHFFQGPDLQSKSMKRLHPDLRPGDAFIHNDPYDGNSHPHDWSILVPVFDHDGIHRFTVVVKAHLADVGNAFPMRIHLVKDVYEEGPLIFPCVKVQSDYQTNNDIIRMCMLRIRVPEMWLGDFQALLGAARVAERQLKDVMAEYGRDTMDDFVDEWFDYSEGRMSREIGRMRSGSATVNTRFDSLPGFEDGLEIRATVEVDAVASMVRVDLTDNIDCQPFAYNLTEATALSTAFIGVFSSLAAPVPINAGSFRRVEVELRENCVVGIPKHPISCFAATTHLAETVAIAVATGLAQVGEGLGLAEAGRLYGGALAAILGNDPRNGRGDFVDMLLLSAPSGPASAHADGWVSLGAMGPAGAAMHDSIEIDELKYPMIIFEERLVPDTEGAGRYRGAPAALVSYGSLPGAEFNAFYDCDGVSYEPRGVRGGGNGSSAKHYMQHADGSVTALGRADGVHLVEGERFVSLSCGGGGYGPPAERDSERVRWDVEQGWVSRERAAAIYGVIVDHEFHVDAEATRQARATR